MTEPGPVPIPDWIATLVGQLVLENQALRLESDALRQSLNGVSQTGPQLTSPSVTPVLPVEPA